MGYPDLLVLTPLPMPLRTFFSRYSLFTLTGAVGAAHLCPAGTDLGSCRSIDERMQGSLDALGVVIFCDLRQSQAPQTLPPSRPALSCDQQTKTRVAIRTISDGLQDTGLDRGLTTVVGERF